MLCITAVLTYYAILCYTLLCAVLYCTVLHSNYLPASYTNIETLVKKRLGFIFMACKTVSLNKPAGQRDKQSSTKLNLSTVRQMYKLN